MSEFRGITVYDPRIYLAIALGGGSMFLCSRRGVAAWPFQSNAKVEIITLVLTVLVLPVTFFFCTNLSVARFDFGVGFAGGILFSFGLVLALRLIRFRIWLYRVTGMLFASLYGYLIYDTMSAWAVLGRWHL